MTDESTPSAKKHSVLSWLDRICMGMVGFCAMHCLLTPIVLVALPIIGATVFAHEDFHFWMLLAVIPTTGFAISLGCRKHKDKWVFLLAAVGIALLATALLVGHPVSHGGHAHGWLEHNLETILTMIGGLFLASGHYRNFKLCQDAHCSHEDHCCNKH